MHTKEAQIEMHRKKIELYKKYIPAFQEIGDEDRVAICNSCIKKNEGYIDAILNGRSHAIEQGYDIGGYSYEYHGASFDEK